MGFRKDQPGYARKSAWDVRGEEDAKAWAVPAVIAGFDILRRFPGKDHFTTRIPLIQVFRMLHGYPHLFAE
jgi:hypothetical protein